MRTCLLGLTALVIIAVCMGLLGCGNQENRIEYHVMPATSLYKTRLSEIIIPEVDFTLRNY